MKLRWHWGTGITLVYTAFAVATTSFVVYASRQRVDLVSDDYYQQSLDLDRHLAAEENAAAASAVRFDVSADSRFLTLTWRAGAVPESGTVTLYRPADAPSDRHVGISVDANGRQILSLNGLAPGRWIAQVQWRSRGRDYYAERELVTP
jgi:hypothetical protein